VNGTTRGEASGEPNDNPNRAAEADDDEGGIDIDALSLVDDLFDPPPSRRPSAEQRGEAKVVRSYRIPTELDQWLTAQARERGVSNSDLVRDLLELGRSTVEGSDRTISLADAIRALAAVHSVVRVGNDDIR